MKFENIKTFNIDGALHGMRNPMNSWARTDTVEGVVGPNDMKLAQQLISAGPEHCKFLRQIFVTIDITAPLFWWKEMDQYKIGTTTNSTSTMHKLASTPITLDCFELGDFDKEWFDNIEIEANSINNILYFLEELRLKYLETKDMRYWKELVRWLPEAWLQTRTWSADYAVLRNIYHQRKNHKLVEWHQFCDMIEKEIPYANEFIIFDKNKKI